MTEATQLLNAIDQGDPTAASQLLPLVYDELRRLAAARLAVEPPGNALQPTALPYLVMELIPGETLPQRLDRTGPLEALEIVRIARLFNPCARHENIPLPLGRWRIWAPDRAQGRGPSIDVFDVPALDRRDAGN